MTRKMMRCVLLGLVVGACGGQAEVVVEPPVDPDLVVLEADLGNEYVPAGEPSEVVARLRVSTRAMPNRQRPPINLAVVIDTSGSMRGQPIEDARGATLELLDLLEDTDRLSIVAFHSRTEVLLESSFLDAEARATARGAVESIEARGTTDMAGGLSAGLQQVLANSTSELINRVVLLGDGVPNEASAIPNLARSAGGHGVAISALGLGLDYDETLMGEIAQLSGGHFQYLEESEAVAGVFREEVLRLERVLARNVSLTLQPGPGVSILSIVGQEAPGGGATLSVALGDIAEGETRDIIVRMSVPAKRDGAAVELIDATLNFVDAVDEAGALARNVFLGADATGDQAELLAGRNTEVLQAAEEATAAAATIQAIRVVREGNMAQARQILEENQRRMSKSGGPLNRAMASSIDAFAQELDDMEAAESAEEPGSAQPTAPAPPSMERRLREAHETSMGVLGY